MHSTAKLSSFENKFYVLICIVSCIIFIYQVFLAGDYLSEHGQGFIEGWKWLGRKRDNHDRQWRIWRQFIPRIMPWIFLQIIISQLLKYVKVHKMIICCWYIFITGTFLWNYSGIGGIVYLLIPTCITCLLSICRSKLLVYIIYSLILIVCRFSLISDIIYFLVNVNTVKYYLLTAAFYRLQLKGINYCIDNIDHDKYDSVCGFLENMIECMAYCWYLPTFFTGPHILFCKFNKGLDAPIENWSLRRMIFQLVHLMRFIVWFFINEVMCHYLYITALLRRPHQLAKLSGWAFYGFGYCLVQHFCNKYIILYGIASEISRIDNIEAPSPPKCISRMHLSSDMWKYFDRGLYEFILRYIYYPIYNINIPLRKLFAPMMTFLFVYMWNGIHKFVFIWIVLNSIGWTLESTAKSIGNSKIYQKQRDKLLSSQNTRRINCVLATPLLAMSIIANIYFVGGVPIGYIYLRRFVSDPPIIVFIVMFVLYCVCQVSTEMKLNEHSKARQCQHRESIGKKLH